MIELWGAQGGSYYAYGGYTSGQIHLEKDELLYVYVGRKGTTGTSYSFNGGAPSANGSGNSGGGATDVRTIATNSNSIWKETLSLRSRIMVAAGGGGDDDGASSSNDGRGGHAGGLNGYSGTGGAKAGSQISGSSFGYGSAGTSNDGGGGGGGYYGGVGGNNGNSGGSGGSSYISGHAGCIGIDSSGNSLTSSYSKIEDSYSYTKKVFTETKMIDGAGYNWTTVKGSSVSGMPNYANSDLMTGNSGNGYAKITYLGQ